MEQFPLTNKKYQFKITQQPYFKSSQLIPSQEQRFRAFQLVGSPHNVRVIILGQDPYPRAESANGLSFCDARSVYLYDKLQSVSMRNVLKAVISSRGTQCDSMPDVSAYIQRNFKYEKTTDYFTHLAQDCGVFFINSSLTYEDKSQTKKHANFWRDIVVTAINECVSQSRGCVLVLWGNYAQQLGQLIKKSEKLRTVECEHPMNFSFVKSQCFEKIRQAEQELLIGVTDWCNCTFE